MFKGERVTTKEQWVNKRRPELKALFQYYMYGYLPPAPDRVESKVEFEDRQAFDGKATLKEITLSFGPPGTPPYSPSFGCAQRPQRAGPGLRRHELLRQPHASQGPPRCPADRVDAVALPRL
jgi:hypothetical protein